MGVVTAYVGSTFRCGGPVADRMGLAEGQQVAWLTADGQSELWLFAAEMGLPDVRMMGSGPMLRYVVTGLERNRALARGAEFRSGLPGAR
jgi:hypothetical protein